MVEVKNLKKFYGKQLVLDDISFSLGKGEILGFLGLNGAGKSTTMNIITGYISSNSGTVTIDGSEILENPIQAKSKIGYLPENPPLYQDMSVKGYLDFMFDLKKIKMNKQEHIKEVCELTGINEVYHRIIKNLSKGYRQRVGIAQALLGNPPVLIFDEPTVGLDPKQIIEIRKLIKNLSKDNTVILSSHILTEVQALCDRVLIINKGKIVAQGTTDELSSKVLSGNKFVFSIEGTQEKIDEAIKDIENISEIKLLSKQGNIINYEISSKSDIDIRKDVFEALANKRLPIMGLRSAQLNLEETFLKLTSGEEILSKEINDTNEDNSKLELDKNKDLDKEDTENSNQEETSLKETDNINKEETPTKKSPKPKAVDKEENKKSTQTRVKKETKLDKEGGEK